MNGVSLMTRMTGHRNGKGEVMYKTMDLGMDGICSRDREGKESCWEGDGWMNMRIVDSKAGRRGDDGNDNPDI